MSAALTTGTAARLAAVTATPLGLWLVRAVVIDDHRPPTVLTDTSQFPSAAALRAYLLDGLIPATVRARPRCPAGVATPRNRRCAPPAGSTRMTCDGGSPPLPSSCVVAAHRTGCGGSSQVAPFRPAAPASGFSPPSAL